MLVSTTRLSAPCCNIKRPRGSAQFLQRKGRAGRVRGMRPWTVVVLSDYGRDRLAYQGYDLLFDPIPRSQHAADPEHLRPAHPGGFRHDGLAGLEDASAPAGLGVARPRRPTQRNQPQNENAPERQRRELDLIDTRPDRGVCPI